MRRRASANPGQFLPTRIVLATPDRRHPLLSLHVDVVGPSPAQCTQCKGELGPSWHGTRSSSREEWFGERLETTSPPSSGEGRNAGMAPGRQRDPRVGSPAPCLLRRAAAGGRRQDTARPARLHPDARGSRRATFRRLARREPARLSDRERGIYARLSEGRSNQAINGRHAFRPYAAWPR